MSRRHRSDWSVAVLTVLVVTATRVAAAVGTVPAAAGRSCDGAPADWAESCIAGDLLFLEHDCALCVLPANRRPEIGNGYLAIQVASQTPTPLPPKMPTSPSGPLYLAGVFNGCGAKSCKMNPSQRAAISPPLPMHVLGHEMTAMAALDLVGATYTRRYKGDLFDAQLRMYAHRSRRNLLITEVTATRGNGTSTVSLGGSFGAHPSGESFTWEVSTHPCVTGECIVWSGTTKEAEIGIGKPVMVAVVFDNNSSGLVQLQTNESKALVAAMCTSLDSANPVAAAVAEYNDAKSITATKLYEEHAAAWALLWESGFEVTGRPDVAAVVNSSLYYIMSSVREDTVHSLSPGGLASNGYNGHTFWDCKQPILASMTARD
jgi:hypothetical protein